MQPLLLVSVAGQRTRLIEELSGEWRRSVMELRGGKRGENDLHRWVLLMVRMSRIVSEDVDAQVKTHQLTSANQVKRHCKGREGERRQRNWPSSVTHLATIANASRQGVALVDVGYTAVPSSPSIRRRVVLTLAAVEQAYPTTGDPERGSKRGQCVLQVRHHECKEGLTEHQCW